MKEYAFQDENCRGTLRHLDYIGRQGARKYALVYLPFGYDDDPARRYNILYLMHGGGGNPDSWTDSCRIKNMLDHCFAAGEAEPMLVVFPTFYTDGARRTPGVVDEQFEHGSVRAFQTEELVQCLIPAVEGELRTFAEGTDPASLKRARGHRAFGGFSMGSVNTWYAFSLHLDYFSVFLPLSGDCWELEVMGGSRRPKETVALFRNAVSKFGFGPEDFNIFAATGTKDIAYPNLTPQIEAMKAESDLFRFSEDPAQGNLHFLLAEGWEHTYDAVCQYVYHYLPYLFRG